MSLRRRRCCCCGRSGPETWRPSQTGLNSRQSAHARYSKLSVLELNYVCSRSISAQGSCNCMSVQSETVPNCGSHGRSASSTHALPFCATSGRQVQQRKVSKWGPPAKIFNFGCTTLLASKRLLMLGIAHQNSFPVRCLTGLFNPHSCSTELRSIRKGMSHLPLVSLGGGLVDCLADRDGPQNVKLPNPMPETLNTGLLSSDSPPTRCPRWRSCSRPG